MCVFTVKAHTKDDDDHHLVHYFQPHYLYHCRLLLHPSIYPYVDDSIDHHHHQHRLLRHQQLWREKDLCIYRKCASLVWPCLAPHGVSGGGGGCGVVRIL